MMAFLVQFLAGSVRRQQDYSNQIWVKWNISYNLRLKRLHGFHPGVYTLALSNIEINGIMKQGRESIPIYFTSRNTLLDDVTPWNSLQER